MTERYLLGGTNANRWLPRIRTNAELEAEGILIDDDAPKTPPAPGVKPEAQTPLPSNPTPGWLYVPQINMEFCPELDGFGKNIYDAYKLCLEQGFIMPSPRETWELFFHAKANRDIDEFRKHYEFFTRKTKAGTWHSEWQDAFFKKQPDGKMLMYRLKGFDANGNPEFHQAKDITGTYLTTDCFADISNIQNITLEGLCNTADSRAEYTEGENIFSYYPRDGAVVWFVAYSDRADFICDRGPTVSDPSLGVRFARRLAPPSPASSAEIRQGEIYVPALGAYFTKDVLLMRQSKNWRDSHFELANTTNKQLAMPTIEELRQFFAYLYSNKSSGVKDATPQEIKNILDFHFEKSGDWRGIWLDADFKYHDASGKPINSTTTKGIHKILYNHDVQGSDLIPRSTGILTDTNTLMASRNIDLQAWLATSNQYGLPLPNIPNGDYTFWHPLKDNNSVARFVAYSGGAVFDCGAGSVPSLWVRAVRRLRNS